MKVTALLISHNGARWLPAVLGGLEQSTVLPAEIVPVDTGSVDQSPALVRAALGVDPISLPPETGFGAAVRAGLAGQPPAEPDEWVWLLHDDANPAPTCLEELLAAAAEAGEEYAVIGPKLCEWPSLRRLLEVGVTISGTGRRETGLEPGEYDQGQHDRIHPVLAVNTAGMLVRREVLEQVGFDDLLPIMGNDLDFGWRAALAGHRAVVLPQAVMYHVEAAHRGQRETTLVRHPRQSERAAAISTLLLNSPAALLPWRVLRLFFGGLLRVLGFLLVRASAEARDELAALLWVYARPGRILAGRRARRGKVTVERREVRPLLAPAWLPYRHGLDFVSDVAALLLDLGREWLTRRDAHGRSPVRRTLTSPVLWAALVLAVVSVLANRELLSGTPLHGGALLNSPDGAGHWWSLWASGWHWLGTGSSQPAPAYVLVLAVLGSLLLGATSWVIWLLFVMVVPLSVISAHRFTRRVMPGRWAPLWAAVAYALVPVLSGAVQQGRLGTVAAAILLPVAATSALGMASADPERRERARWRTAIGVGLLVAFVPVALALVLLLLALAPYLLGTKAGPGAGPEVGPTVGHKVGWSVDWRRVLMIPVVALLLVLPWAIGTLSVPGAWLLEAGRADVLQLRPTWWELLLGRSGGPGSAPWWMALGLPVAALAALVRPDTRHRVARAWVVVAAAALVLLGVSFAQVELPGVVGAVRPWLGFPLLVVQAGLVVAAGIGAAGVVRVASEASFGWRQVVGALAALGAIAAPVLGGAWWFTSGETGPLNRGAAASLPTYMTELSATTNSNAVLVLRGGSRGTDVRYRVLREDTLRVGDDGVLALTPERTDLTTALGSLLAGSDPGVSQELSSFGIAYVYAPPRVSAAVAGAFDAADGFTGASAPAPDSRAWRLEGPATLTAVGTTSNLPHLLALVVQLVAVLAAVVLALPGRRRR